MPGREEILRSISGAFRLACLDQAGMEQFNLTVEGFWRSFIAVLLVAPGYALLIGRDLAVQTEPVDLGLVVVVESAAYLVAWMAFPLAALLLTRLLNLTAGYVPLIIAANWAAVIQIGGFLGALGLATVLPGFLGSLLVTIVTCLILYYQWFVTRTALRTTGVIAVLFVLVDLVLNTAINVGADRLAFGPAASEPVISNPTE